MDETMKAIAKHAFVHEHSNKTAKILIAKELYENNEFCSFLICSNELET